MPVILAKVSSPVLASVSEALASLSAPRPTLADLAETAGLSVADLAARCGCAAELLDRVSARRQALPERLLAPLARALGAQAGEVRAACGAVVEGADATALRPYPADRLLGEPLYPRPTSPTRPVVFGS